MAQLEWIAQSDQLNPRHFVIREDEAVGFYLYVFENDKCIEDFLQDSFEAAIAQASDEFGVPRDLWQRIASAP